MLCWSKAAFALMRNLILATGDLGLGFFLVLCLLLSPPFSLFQLSHNKRASYSFSLVRGGGEFIGES